MDKAGAFPIHLQPVIEDVLSPGRFLLTGDLSLECQHVNDEEIVWEIFHGRLLDGAQTRQTQRFEAWNVYASGSDGRAPEPLLAVKVDHGAGLVFVVRSILSHAWEAYETGANVIDSRPVLKWLRELVATIDPKDLATADDFRAVLAQRVYQAVVGVSRLPLTSVEAPLPAFTLGEVAYFPSAVSSAGPMTCSADLIDRALTVDLPATMTARLLETLLRATPLHGLDGAARRFAERWRTIGRSLADFAALFLAVFDEVALSPYTDFVDRSLRLLELLEGQGNITAAQHADCLTGLLRRIARHLTAFDLVKFHHRGANYPDALLLDALLKGCFILAERQPTLFSPAGVDSQAEAKSKRLRRRGVRQGWLLRCRYEGHPVPDVPTSPGDNARVLPANYPHVPDEQIVDPAQRPRRLFQGDELPQASSANQWTLLDCCLRDLAEPNELQELGMALFLDRPLGAFKRPGEPDQTLLLSYVAFSRSVAERHLQLLVKRAGEMPDVARCRQLLGEIQPPGIALALQPAPNRPGVPSLQDAFQVAADFVLLHTTRRSVDDFVAQFDLQPIAQRLDLAWLRTGTGVVIVSGAALGRPPNRLSIFDAEQRERLEFDLDPQAGYATRGLVEAPAHGLRLLRAWEIGADGVLIERDMSAEELRVQPGSARLEAR